ncbi:MAG: DUF4124 domain-containing protein [Gammaproteobacteria bacterium]|nr:DUF4124 domain-containing protein [Gammaproteobacteria bacterium]MBU6509289.1 DUF4124 domain-containing protein [Gammaproteobacteria bacterium]MDE1983510.1 DUF4124 domain-containing protein [Gammaproteobacteria bacterium]MDE2107925.1 DUF4124 domain-containing protein [Gammaproteobacteria bacterium]MDE2460254.1 DUF4124 domain-containing protein [Gammaproteobacteria bacterium]
MSRVSTMVFLVCGAALYSAAAVAGGSQIYKWTDSQGVVHYSDTAPATLQPDLQQMTLQALPAPDPKALAEDQAWVASINNWYQTVLNDQAQLEYEQLLASQAAQSPAPQNPPEEIQQVSYVTPFCWDCERFHFHHRSHRPLLSMPTPQSFQNSLWHPQPNPFTQSLYKP